MQKILCAIDFSAGSDKVVAKSAQWATLQNAELHLLTVVETIPSMASRYIDAYSIQQNMETEAGKSMHEIAGQHAISEAHCHILNGHARQVIIDMANEMKVDLIILASHGHYGIAGSLLGSVSRTIANEANCDVYIVRK